MLVQDIAGLYIPQHDYISISPTAAPSTGDQAITYKLGGASGTDTGHTIVGAATAANGASGRFASRRTGANTFVTYRLV